MDKLCKDCGSELGKPYAMSDENFAKRQFCNRDCRTAWRRKHPEEERGVFPKGNVPHNKGLKGLQPYVNLEGLRKYNAKYGSWNKKKNMSEETRAKVRVARAKQDMSGRRGANHHNWQGGITPLNRQVRNCLEYKRWRRAVYERDGYVCRLCGHQGRKDVRLDHIKSFASIMHENNIKSLEQARACSQLWDVDNGRVLCWRCDFKTATYGSKSIVR